SRPFGGWCGDRIGGGISVIACYAVLVIGTIGVIASLPDAQSRGSFWLFLAMCQLLFLAAGIGNGAAYQLAPKVFMLQAGREAHARGETVAQTYQRGTRRGTAAMGVSSVMAAFGGFVIPETFGYSLETAGSFVPAFVLFLLFYLLCAAIAWRCYARAGALDNPAPSYPERSRERGEEGRVVLRVEVGADGRVRDIAILQSSGFPRLDRAARDAVERWRFTPARRGNSAVADRVDVPIRFRQTD
ncbi:TonB family protein, partial [Aquitalea sp. S1-19]|nr:TonB family protein [Aquitalea sp. S1-19]